MDATRVAAAVGATGCATIDGISANVDDGIAAENKTTGAAWYAARAAADEHDGATTTVWPGNPIQAHVLMGRGGF